MLFEIEEARTSRGTDAAAAKLLVASKTMVVMETILGVEVDR